MSLRRRAARRWIQQILDRFYRWAALPGDRWEQPERHLRAAVVGFHRGRIRLEVVPAGPPVDRSGWPELPGDSRRIETIEPFDRGWRPIPTRV